MDTQTTIKHQTKTNSTHRATARKGAGDWYKAGRLLLVVLSLALLLMQAAMIVVLANRDAERKGCTHGEFEERLVHHHSHLFSTSEQSGTVS